MIGKSRSVRDPDDRASVPRWPESGLGLMVARTLVNEGAAAADMLGRAFLRGSKCTGDFTTADHLALAATPLADVREQFGVSPL